MEEEKFSTGEFFDRENADLQKQYEMNNTSMNFNTPYFNKDAKLTKTISKNEQRDPILIKEELKSSNLNSTSQDFNEKFQQTLDESVSDFQDREDISQSNQANVFFKSHLRRFYAQAGKRPTNETIEQSLPQMSEQQYIIPVDNTD